MQAHSEAYLLGASSVPLMTAAEELERAHKIRRLRHELWTAVVEHDEGPRATLAALRELDPVAAKRMSPRLSRASRSERLGDRALETLVKDLVDLDRSGELSNHVLDGLRPEGVRIERAESRRHAWRREKDRFVLANMGLVFKVATRFHSPTLSLHDLVQDGALGLMRAVDMFDPDKGFRFSTYAVWWIRHAMGRAVADRSRTIRVPVHLITLQAKLRKERPRLTEALGREPTRKELAHACRVTEERVGLAEQAFSTSVVSLESPRKDDADPLDLPDDEDVRETLEFQLAARSLEDILHELDNMEADVVRKRFGLEQASPMTLQEIGKEYALSRERIRQIELKALEKMREQLRVA